jgi:hypothetical protein
MRLRDLFTKRPSGLLVPKAQGFVLGKYDVQHFRKGELIDEFEAKNICTNEGLIFMLNLMFTNATNVGGWYMAVFTNNYTPVATDTAATITGNAGEFTGYSGGARPTFSPAAAAQPTPSLNNTSNRASFTFTGSATLIGAFLVSSATPGGTSGTLYSAAQFPSSKSVSNTDNMLLSYTLALGSS